jgi:alanine dehydrogenase
MKPHRTLLLTRVEIAELLGIRECISAVEQAFRLYAEGKTAAPGVLSVHAPEGAFHIKAGLLDLNKKYFAAKTNANFPGNQTRFQLPLIQGVIVLCDGENGFPLAVMDSSEITIVRTGAATALAAQHLARPDAKIATICGCGNQGSISLRSLMEVRRLERVEAFDIDEGRARSFSDHLSRQLGIEINVTTNLAESVSQSDICVTCTPSKKYYLNRAYVGPGTFIAAVGADSEIKQELDPLLLQGNKIVVDLLEQCAVMGELHHALSQELIRKTEVHAELGDVITGKKAGRTSAEEIIIFDSTGMALQDVAAAAIVYEKAISQGAGSLCDLV